MPLGIAEQGVRERQKSLLQEEWFRIKGAHDEIFLSWLIRRSREELMQRLISDVVEMWERIAVGKKDPSQTNLRTSCCAPCGSDGP